MMAFEHALAGTYRSWQKAQMSLTHTGVNVLTHTLTHTHTCAMQPASPLPLPNVHPPVLAAAPACVPPCPPRPRWSAPPPAVA
eukprot:scaffold49042_cov18-Tisochrysis_lutea.AAC.1